MQIRSVVVVAALGLASFAHGQHAVQWRVEDGGNGHWYLVATQPRTFFEAREWAIAHGGSLALIDSAQENQFLFATILDQAGPWVGAGPFFGLYQDPTSKAFGEPGSGWVWCDGLPRSSRFDGFCGGQPDNAWMGQNLAVYWAPAGVGPLSCWDDDVSWVDMATHVGPHLIEWSADCNGDGIVDFGQILDGTFEDANENGVPDCCDAGESCTPCPGDVNDSGIVNGTDIAIILGAWGTSGGKFPRSDTDGNGIVDAADLAVVLGGWGPCPK
jgi:hypothetical protein